MNTTIKFKSSDYNLDEEERKEKYKNYKFILCEKCKQKINKGSYCKKKIIIKLMKKNIVCFMEDVKNILK
jgi:hypothetical protein